MPPKQNPRPPVVPLVESTPLAPPGLGPSFATAESAAALDALKDAIYERDYMRRQLRVVTHLDSGSENDVEDDDERPNETERWHSAGNGETVIYDEQSPLARSSQQPHDLGGRRSTLRNLKANLPPPATAGAAAYDATAAPTHFKFRLGIKVLNDSKWRHLKVMYGRQRFYLHTPSVVVAIMTLLVTWGFLYFALDDDGRQAVLPGGWIFDPFVLILLSGVIGGILSVILHMPPLLCILWTSIGVTAMLGINLKDYRDVTHPVKTVGLAMILLRGGISVNLKAIRPIKWTVALLSVVPLLAEICVLTFVNAAIWNRQLQDDKFELKEGFLFGATVSPLSSSIIVTSALHLQSAGYGLMGGPPPVMIASVPFDSALGIWLANFALELCLPSASYVVDDTSGSGSGSGVTPAPPMSATYAPRHHNTTSPTTNFLSKAPASLLQIPLGIIGGAVCGVVAEMLVNVLYGDRGNGKQSAKRHDDPQDDDDRDLRTNLHNRSFALLFGGCIMFMSLTAYYGVEGMGSLFVAAFGTALGTRWRARTDGDDRRKQFASRAAVVWNLCLMPALFAFVGASADFSKSRPSDIGFMVLVILAGCATRMTIAFLCSLTSRDMSRRERLLLAAGWVGKASAQATLGMAVRDRVEEYCVDPSTCVHWRLRGQTLSTLSVLMIMVAAPISAITIRVFGRHCVRKDDLLDSSLGILPPHIAPPVGQTQQRESALDDTIRV